jgi:adenylate kinase
VGAVLAALEKEDFYVVARACTHVSPAAAQSLLDGCHVGAAAEPASAEAVAAVTEGAAEVLLLERRGAILGLRRLVGPPPSVARGSAPASLCALLGADDLRRGVIAARSTEQVEAVLVPAFFPEPLPLERTLCVIKPGTAEQHYRAIVEEIRASGFHILAETRRRLQKEEAEAFYGEHRGKGFFDGLCSYMASGEVIALALAKPAAIKCWRQLMGPTNTLVARRERPQCLRARFGVDGTRNATHGSDSPASAARELRFYFPTLTVAPVSTKEDAIAYVRATVVTQVWDHARGMRADRTLDQVVVEALAALARAKPSSDPAVNIQWLGQWLIDNNPAHGAVEVPAAASASTSPAAAARGPVVSEPDDDAAEGMGASARPQSAFRRRLRGAVDMAAATAPIMSVNMTAAAAAATTAVTSLPASVPSPSAGPKPTIVFVLGGPGSGKGTQCARIAETFGFAHLSTGDLLRDEVASGSELGQQLTATMSSGALVSNDVVLRLLKGAMQKAEAAGNRKFLIDGYPRSVEQAFEFEKTVGQPTMVLAFEAAEAVLEERLVQRGKTSGRADDNVESIRKRFATFVSQSAPVIDFYAKLGLVRLINSERTVDAVFADVVPLFQPETVWLVGGPGAGRSTLGARLAGAGLGYVHLCTHDLLLAEVRAKGPESAEGEAIDRIIRRGDAVPTDVVVRLLKEAVDRLGPLGRFVIDGAPATAEQATALERALGRPRFVVHLAASDKVLMQRCADRRAQALASGSPNAAKSGAARADDLKAVVKVRVAAFREHVDAMLDPYVKGAMVRRVDATKHADTVYAQVRKYFTPDIVFVLGGPGSGKGTQCANIVRDFGYTHLSAGDLLRSEVSRGSQHGALINQYIADGKIVPVDITLDLLRRAMLASRSRRFLIDGFPRELQQTLDFEKTVGQPAFVLFFNCPEETMRERLLERGKTSGRSDDNDATIIKRFRTFLDQSMPVINRYAGQGKVKQIDATPAPDVVYAAVKPLFAAQAVLALGLPGSSKGTQCDNIVRDFGYTHLSTGDLLRAEVARGSPQGEAIAACMREGQLVSDDITLGLLKQAMASAPNRKFLLDGFPRSMAQAEALDAVLGGPPTLAIYLEVPKEVALARLLKRGKTSGRGDDNEEAIKKRFATFDEQSAPVITFYKGRSIVRTVSALPPADQVYTALRQYLQPQLAVVVGTVGSGRRELAERAGRELGYHTLQVTKLLEEEAASGSEDGAAIAAAFAAKRTAPLPATLRVIRSAMAHSPAQRFLLDGFPRVVSAGFPGVHDQVFALEAEVGPVKGCICLEADEATRLTRTGAKTAGEIAAVKVREQTLLREKMPVVPFFQRLGKAASISTNTARPDEVYEAARPFLE